MRKIHDGNQTDQNAAVANNSASKGISISPPANTGDKQEELVKSIGQRKKQTKLPSTNVLQLTKWQWDGKNKEWNYLREEALGRRGPLVIYDPPEFEGVEDGEIYDDIAKKFSYPDERSSGEIESALLVPKASVSIRDKRAMMKLIDIGGYMKKFIDYLSLLGLNEEFKTQIGHLKYYITEIQQIGFASYSLLNDQRKLSTLKQKAFSHIGKAKALITRVDNTIVQHKRLPGKGKRDRAARESGWLNVSGGLSYFMELYQVESRRGGMEAYDRPRDERSDQIATGTTISSTVSSVTSGAASISYAASQVETLSKVGDAVSGLGGAIEGLQGLHQIYHGVMRTDSAVGKMGSIAEGAATATKGASSAYFYGAQVLGTEASKLGAGALGQVLPVATLAQGGMQATKGVIGTVRSQQAINKIKEATEDDPFAPALTPEKEKALKISLDAMQNKRTESIGKIGSGVVTIAAGVILLAAGLSNPIGWYVLAAAGLVTLGATVWNRVQQRMKGKEIAEQKNREYQVALREWHIGGQVEPKPMLNERYDKSRITAFSWRTYGDVYREEMAEQSYEVARVLYSQVHYGDTGQPETQAMIQVVKNLGLRINNSGKPTLNDIQSQLKKRIG